MDILRVALKALMIQRAIEKGVKGMTFEEKLTKLSQIVEKLEAGSDLPLESSLKLFEEGIGLVVSCREMLETAEQRVTNLLETDEPRTANSE